MTGLSFGYGIGLPLSRLHAKYLGGALDLVSLPGYGVDVTWSRGGPVALVLWASVLGFLFSSVQRWRHFGRFLKFCFIQGEWENCWLHLIIFVLYLSWLDESIILLVTSTCLVVNSPVSSISVFFTLGQGQQFSYQKSSPLCNLDFDDISIHFPSFPHHFTIHLLRKRLPPRPAPPHRRHRAASRTARPT